jgi:enoyl-CoA hydratase/carnithine racemase
MTEAKVLTRVEGRVFHLTINRPERRNAIDPETHLLMHEAFERFSADDELWVAVIRGAGDKAFSAGGDLLAIQESRKGGATYTIPATGYGGLTSRFDLIKPVIAAVNGLAMGGGFEITMACDLAIAADHATFALPEPRSSIFASAGGMHRLPRQISHKRAMYLLLTGERISAAEALEWGLVNEVVPLEDLDMAVDRLVQKVLKNSPLAVRATKQCAQMGADLTLSQAIAKQDERGYYPAIRTMVSSPDLMEGLTAFSQRRTPNWTGKAGDGA